MARLRSAGAKPGQIDGGVDRMHYQRVAQLLAAARADGTRDPTRDLLYHACALSGLGPLQAVCWLGLCDVDAGHVFASLPLPVAIVRLQRFHDAQVADEVRAGAWCDFPETDEDPQAYWTAYFAAGGQ